SQPASDSLPALLALLLYLPRQAAPPVQLLLRSQRPERASSHSRTWSCSPPSSVRTLRITPGRRTGQRRIEKSREERAVPWVLLARGRHGVVSTLAKRVAPRKPFGCQPTAAENAVAFDRFCRVLRARRHKAARSYKYR